MAYGRPIFHAREHKAAAVNVLGPRQAAAEVLREYLRCAVFVVRGGAAPDRPFSLRRVDSQWPDSSKPLDTPLASVTDSIDTGYGGDEAQLQPYPLEETLGEFDCLVGYALDPTFPKTVLWRTGEAEAEFQVDFWLSDTPEREAVEARLGFLFNPGEERTGVLLGGHPKYYDRVVRATLISSSLEDLEDSVYPNERRLRATVRCQVAVVDLRIATLLTPRVNTEVSDPNDPGATS